MLLGTFTRPILMIKTRDQGCKPDGSRFTPKLMDHGVNAGMPPMIRFGCTSLWIFENFSDAVNRSDLSH